MEIDWIIVVKLVPLILCFCVYIKSTCHVSL